MESLFASHCCNTWHRKDQAGSRERKEQEGKGEDAICMVGKDITSFTCRHKAFFCLSIYPFSFQKELFSEKICQENQNTPTLKHCLP